MKTHRAQIPAIVIGNLELGGTGKTPHLEWVVRALEGSVPLATLSRGYGREGTTFHEVQATDTASRSGDEPLQIKHKFPGVRVFVGADRVQAITRIRALAPEIRAIVLDDAFQHRRLKAHFNILLTTWDRPWNRDALLPAGRLRDLPARAAAAQAVIVTKCPGIPDAPAMERWRNELGLLPHQELFFSVLEHAPAKWLNNPEQWHLVPDGAEASALLVTGIARPAPLLEHVRRHWGRVEHMAFADHHAYTARDAARLAERYANFARQPGVLLTTEKDVPRLAPYIQGPLAQIPIAVVPVAVRILNQPERLHAQLRSLVGTH